MLAYLLLSVGMAGALFVCKTNTYSIVKDTIVSKYRKFRNLNMLVSTQYKNICIIVYHSICIICSAVWLDMVQYLNNSVKKLDKKRYEVSYVVSGKLYRMIVMPNKGPSSVLLACDEDGEDITDVLISYMGPHNDFHGADITPKLLNKKQIIIETIDGCEKIFNEDDVLVNI
jgi:hypothetical protein